MSGTLRRQSGGTAARIGDNRSQAVGATSASLTPFKRHAERRTYQRWERGRAMKLWQIDVMGGVLIDDGKCLASTGAPPARSPAADSATGRGGSSAVRA